jgi:hypothetical protein
MCFHPGLAWNSSISFHIHFVMFFYYTSKNLPIVFFLFCVSPWWSHLLVALFCFYKWVMVLFSWFVATHCFCLLLLLKTLICCVFYYIGKTSSYHVPLLCIPMVFIIITIVNNWPNDLHTNCNPNLNLKQ